jgi:N-acetylglutamate synthase-like GNAT family acetyltransferase
MMNESINIRKANVNDLPFIHELIIESFEAMKEHSCFPVSFWRLSADKLIDNELHINNFNDIYFGSKFVDNCFWVAEKICNRDISIVGCVGLKRENIKDNSIVELVRMSVTRKCRSKGIGTLLVNKLVEYCKERKDVKTIKFTTGNPLSAIFYQKNNFKVSNYRLFYHGIKTLPIIKKKRINIAYYITGHGFGHATRSIEVIRGLLKSNNYNILISTCINENFIRKSLKDCNCNSVIDGEDLISYYFNELDAGAIQVDALNVDCVNSLEKYFINIHSNREFIIKKEIEFLTNNKIEKIISDATSICCYVAKLINIKCVLITNFTWDFIYSNMLYESKKSSNELISRYSDMIKQITTDISTVDLYIQLPGQTPIPKDMKFNKILQGPLLTRLSNKNREELRLNMNIKSTDRLCLLGFGGHNNNIITLKDEFLPDEWICLVLGSTDGLMPSKRFISISFDEYIPDYVLMADVVLGKLGYGFVSECLSHYTPLIYINRNNWAEEKYLEDLLISYKAGISMPLIDFQNGNWKRYLDEGSKLRNIKWNFDKEIDPVNAITNIIDILSIE